MGTIWTVAIRFPSTEFKKPLNGNGRARDDWRGPFGILRRSGDAERPVRLQPDHDFARSPANLRKMWLNEAATLPYAKLGLAAISSEANFYPQNSRLPKVSRALPCLHSGTLIASFTTATLPYANLAPAPDFSDQTPGLFLY